MILRPDRKGEWNSILQRMENRSGERISQERISQGSIQGSNAHLRATEQKSLILTGVFVGFYLNGFAAALPRGGIVASGTSEPELTLFHLLLLFVGSVVYVMQLWYRMWKEHYIHVCRATCMEFGSSSNPSEAVLPFWLRRVRKSAWHVSYDDLVHYVTLAVNAGVLFLICADINESVTIRMAATALIIGLAAVYSASVFLVYRHMHNMDLMERAKEYNK